jgi:hypothetical protein
LRLFRKEVTHETLIVDLTGQRFSKLTIVENTGTTEDGIFMWLCKCDCGETTTVKSGHLIKGNTKSCGCLKVDTGQQVQAYHRKHSFTVGRARFPYLFLKLLWIAPVLKRLSNKCLLYFYIALPNVFCGMVSYRNTVPP